MPGEIEFANPTSPMLVGGGHRPVTSEQTERAAETFARDTLTNIQNNPARGARVDDRQTKIYADYRSAFDRVLSRIFSDLPKDAPPEIFARLEAIRAGLTADLTESYKRINQIKKTLLPEVKEATTEALTASLIEERNVTAAELSEVVAGKVYQRMTASFQDKTAPAVRALCDACEGVLGESPRNFAVEDVSEERRRLTPRLREACTALERLESDGRQALAKLRDGQQKTVAEAVGQQLLQQKPMPFYIAPDRPVMTDVPDVPHRDAMSDNARQEMRRAIRSACWRAMLESCLTSGNTLMQPVSTGLTLGLVTAAASENVAKGVAAGAVIGTLQFLQPIIRDGSLAASDLYRNLSGITRNAQLRKPSSAPQQAFQALADRYGTDWVVDFKKWATRPLGLSLANVSTIANAVRGKMNHHLLLTSEADRATFLLSSHDSEIRGEAEKLVARYKREDREIRRHLVNHAYPCGEEDIIGIRCLSHMRDRVASDDVKKLADYLKQNPEFTDGADLCDEATEWIRDKCKYTSGHMTLTPLKPMREEGAVDGEPHEHSISVASLRHRRGYVPLAADQESSSIT